MLINYIIQFSWNNYGTAFGKNVPHILLPSLQTRMDLQTPQSRTKRRETLYSDKIGIHGSRYCVRNVCHQSGVDDCVVPYRYRWTLRE